MDSSEELSKEYDLTGQNSKAWQLSAQRRARKRTSRGPTNVALIESQVASSYQEPSSSVTSAEFKVSSASSSGHGDSSDARRVSVGAAVRTIALKEEQQQGGAGGLSAGAPTGSKPPLAPGSILVDSNGEGRHGSDAAERAGLEMLSASHHHRDQRPGMVNVGAQNSLAWQMRSQRENAKSQSLITTSSDHTRGSNHSSSLTPGAVSVAPNAGASSLGQDSLAWQMRAQRENTKMGASGHTQLSSGNHSAERSVNSLGGSNHEGSDSQKSFTEADIPRPGAVSVCGTTNSNENVMSGRNSLAWKIRAKRENSKRGLLGGSSHHEKSNSQKSLNSVPSLPGAVSVSAISSAALSSKGKGGGGGHRSSLGQNSLAWQLRSRREASKADFNNSNSSGHERRSLEENSNDGFDPLGRKSLAWQQRSQRETSKSLAMPNSNEGQERNRNDAQQQDDSINYQVEGNDCSSRVGQAPSGPTNSILNDLPTIEGSTHVEDSTHASQRISEPNLRSSGRNAVTTSTLNDGVQSTGQTDGANQSNKPQSAEQPKEGEPKSRNMAYIFGIIALIVICGTAIGIAFALSGKASQEEEVEPTAAPSVLLTELSSPTSPPSLRATELSPKDKIKSILPDFTLSALNNQQSPQSKALKWMLLDPNLDLFSNTRKLSRFALATMYYSTNGELWSQSTGWLSHLVDECAWYKLGDCAYNESSKAMEFKSLSLGRIGLDGTIPKEIGFLNFLENLDLSVNNIVGGIPSEIRFLTNLKSLLLDQNFISGTLPSELGKLTFLEVVKISQNQLSKTLPSEIGLLTNLNDLVLRKNLLSGSIPQIGSLTNLINLKLNENKIIGPIPSTFGRLSSLQQLFLQQNKLTGPIPSEVGKLTNLIEFVARQNLLAGSLPSEIGNMTRLANFEVQINQLTGKIPSTIGKLKMLQNFPGYANFFTGTIPTEVGLLDGIRQIHLARNKLTGSLPTEIGSLKRLGFLLLQENSFNGTLPLALFNATNIENLLIGDNSFTGALSTEVGKMNNLITFSVVGNYFNGTLPSEVGQLIKVKKFVVERNMFSGELPTELGNIQAVEELQLHRNQFTGIIPSELGLLNNLKQLHLYNNSLTGSVPPQICNLKTGSLSQIVIDCTEVECKCGCTCDKN